MSINAAFGLATLPRSAQPTMYEILSSGIDQPACSDPQEQRTNKKEQCPKTNRQKRPRTVSHELYSYEPVHLKKSFAKSPLKPKSTKIVNNSGVQQLHLPPEQVKAREQRIKQWSRVTRALPNSSYVTYYGKPAFEVYGRASSTPYLKTHNVMPHKGGNHPKKNQTYYTALLKGRKLTCDNHIPRAPLEVQKSNFTTQPEEIIHLPMQKPDLVNHVRFSETTVGQQGKLKISYNKVTSIKPKRKSVFQKVCNKVKKKVTAEPADKLKYLNLRQNLLQILEKRKTNATKLAYKVTECYPLAQNKPTEGSAGKPRKMQDRVADLMVICHECPF